MEQKKSSLIRRNYLRDAEAVRASIKEAREKRKLKYLLTKRTVFDTLKKFKRNKTKKGKNMNAKKIKKSSRTIQVKMLVPYSIIIAIVLVATGIYIGISYSTHVSAMVETRASQLSKANVQ